MSKKKHKNIIYLPVSVFILLAIAVFSCKGNTKKPIEDLFLPDTNILFEKYEELDGAKAYGAFAKNLMEANRDLKSSQLYVESALLFYETGEDSKAIDLLHKAVDCGMANPKILSKFGDLSEKLHSNRGKSLRKRLDSIQKKLENVTHFTIETEAMNKFWQYFEKARKDTAKAKAIFKQFIFEGPRAIRDFYVIRYNNIGNMYGQMINAAPDYYEYLRQQYETDSLEAQKVKIRHWMLNFQKIYPEAVFPKVFVVPGILNSGGTATEMGMFVGGDMYGRSDNMPTDGLDEWQKGAIMTFSQLPRLTIHELMHFQQNYKDTVNTEKVMGSIISEGVCDFLVELSSGEQLKNTNLKYLEDTERMTKITDDLKKDLHTEDISRWLYNGGIEDRPYDLGYTMGYLICKSYYENQYDKRLAVRELLNTEDFSSIIKKSDYAHILQK